MGKKSAAVKRARRKRNVSLIDTKRGGPRLGTGPHTNARKGGGSLRGDARQGEPPYRRGRKGHQVREDAKSGSPLRKK